MKLLPTGDVLKDLKLLRNIRLYRREPNTDTKEALRAVLEAAVGAKVDEELVHKDEFKHKKERSSCWLALVKRSVPVSFCESLKEYRYGCIAAVARRSIVAVTTEGVPWRQGVDLPGLQLIGYKEMADLAERGASAFERVSLRNFGVSNATLRGMSYEAYDLAGTLPRTGASRRVVRTLRTRTKTGSSRGVTLSTRRLSESGGRCLTRHLAEWMSEIIDIVMLQTSHAGTFLSGFAAPKKLSDLPKKARPNGLLIDVRALQDELSRNEELCAVKVSGKSHTEPYQSLEKDLDQFLEFCSVESNNGVLQINCPKNGKIGHLEFNRDKNVLKLHLDRHTDLRIREGSRAQETVSRWINRNNAIHVTFSDVRYAFASGELLHDRGIASQAAHLSSIIDSDSVLGTAASEKGKKGELQETDEAFPETSLFNMIENSISKKNSILVCDDLGDEWCDYLELSEDGKELTFYHAKHAPKASTGASPFHIVVSQALKNLGRLTASHDDWKKKGNSWAKTYSAHRSPDDKEGNKRTSINLIRRRNDRDDATLIGRIADACASPLTKKTVVLVVNFLAKDKINALLNQLGRSEAASLEPYQVQLIWLLTSFATECQLMGAEPKVLCPDSIPKRGKKKNGK